MFIWPGCWLTWWDLLCQFLNSLGQGRPSEYQWKTPLGKCVRLRLTPNSPISLLKLLYSDLLKARNKRQIPLHFPKFKTKWDIYVRIWSSSHIWCNTNHMRAHSLLHYFRFNKLRQQSFEYVLNKHCLRMYRRSKQKLFFFQSLISSEAFNEAWQRL